MRLIDADALIEALDSFILDETTDVHGDTVREILERLTTIEEHKTGKWLETDSHEPCWYKCDQCGRLYDLPDKYCPNCGADMRGEQE